jgi:nucleotide-binding universal stress UspA family protein
MYKDILVHIDSRPRADIRLEIAIHLAQQSGGRLTGLFAQSGLGTSSTIAKAQSDGYMAVVEQAETNFRQRVASAGIINNWQVVPFGDSPHLIHELVARARCADLTILGQHNSLEEDGLLPSELNEEMVLQSSGPVLFIPNIGHFENVGKKPMVAWNGSREAARALRESIPLIEEASEVSVLGMHSQDEVADPSLMGKDIIEHLALHAIKARYELLLSKDIGVMDLLLSRSADENCDLIVMGAHGNYGFPFLQRSTGTRHILRHMTVPVLMAY